MLIALETRKASPKTKSSHCSRIAKATSGLGFIPRVRMSSLTAEDVRDVQHEVGNPNSLSIDFVNAIYEDSGGSLWIGNDEALNRIDRATGSAPPGPWDSARSLW